MGRPSRYSPEVRERINESWHCNHDSTSLSSHTSPIRKCANLSWKLKRLQTLWFDGIGRNNIKPVRERSRDEASVTFGEKTQEEASTG